MEFIDDWKKQFPKLWSVRFALGSAVAAACQVAFDLYSTGTAPKFAIAAAFGSLCAAGSRIILQPSVTGNGGGNDQA